MVPVADICPPSMVPAADICPPVSKLPVVVLPETKTEFKVIELLQTLELLAPKVNTELAVPGPRLGSACSSPKN